MRFPKSTYVLGFVILLSACGEKGLEVGTPPDPQTGPSSPPPLDRNLIINGDAEDLIQGSKESIEGWSKSPDVLAMNYGGMPDEWQSSKPGCPDGRERYFRLALSINEPGKSISQRINVIGAEADIDAGKLECAAGGWFGGWIAGDASVQLEVDFLDADNHVLGKLVTGAPDPASLPKPEMGRASLIKEIALGAVPPKTRHLEVRLIALRPAQKLDTNAVAAADSLSVVLRRKAN